MTADCSSGLRVAHLHFLFREMKRRFGVVSWCCIGVSGVSGYMSILRKHEPAQRPGVVWVMAYLGWALGYWVIVTGIATFVGTEAAALLMSKITVLDD